MRKIKGKEVLSEEEKACERESEVEKKCGQEERE